MSAAALLALQYADAKGVVSIEDFKVFKSETVNVPVMLTNDVTDNIAGLQFDMDLPEGMEFVDVQPTRTTRISNNVSLIRKGGRFVMVGSRALTGTEGAIFYVPVKVTVSANDNAAISVRNITITDLKGADEYKQEAFKVNVTRQAASIVASMEAPRTVLRPGTPIPVTVALTNNCNIMGFQMNVTMPEGFTIDPENIMLADRCVPTAKIDIFQAEGANVAKVVFSDFNGSATAVKGSEGAVCTFNLIAPEGFEAETAEVKIDKIVVSHEAGKQVEGEGSSIAFINDKVAYDAAMAKVAEVEAAWAAAQDSIASQAPDVKDSFKGEAIAERIAALKGAIEADYEAFAATANAEKNSAEAAAIAEAIAAYVNEAVAAQGAKVEADRVAANNAAIEAANAEVATLAAKVSAAVEAAQKAYPNAEIDAAAANAAVEAQRTAVAAAAKAVEAEGTFACEVSAEEVDAAIAAMEADAKAKQEAYNAAVEADRVAANNAAIEAANAEVAALAAKVSAAVEAAQKAYPNANVDAAAANAAVEAQRTALAEAAKAVETEGTFAYKVSAEEVDSAIAAMEADAKAQQAAADETARVEANAAAYNVAKEAVAALQEKLNEAVATVAAECPAADVTDEKADCQAAIDAQAAAVEAAAEAVKVAGVFNYTVSSAALDRAIKTMIAAAKAQQATADEATRKAENKAAYQGVLADLAAFEAQLEAAKEAAAKYPDANVDADVAAAKEAIAAARMEAMTAYSLVANEGVFSFTLDHEGLAAKILAIETSAKAQQEAHDAAVEAARVAANTEAYNRTIAAIEEIEGRLQAAKDVVAEQYPGVDVTAQVKAVEDEIAAIRAAAEAALAAVAEEGTYAYEFDATVFNGLIDAIYTQAEINGIESIDADALGADAAIYTLSGVRVAKPVQNAVNIIVTNDGRARKVFVK